nr:MAG TPA: hypothetical protein [Caudoviricetes sp.]
MKIIYSIINIYNTEDKDITPIFVFHRNKSFKFHKLSLTTIFGLFLFYPLAILIFNR